MRAEAAARAEDAALLISEIVSNAVRFGGDGPIEVQMETVDDTMRVRVLDPGGPRRPRNWVHEPDGTRGGHGLRLVDAIADSWGVEQGSTIVWFELRIR